MSTSREQVKTALIIAGLVLLSGIGILLIWFLGSSFGLNAPVQILLTMLILLMWPIGVLVKYYRQKGGTQQPALTAEGDAGAQRKQKNAQLPPPTGTYEELTRGGGEVVQWLRGTKLSNAQAGDAVYALPWFLVSGPAMSGKTSLLIASGQDFHTLPSQRAAEQNVIRPTAHCEWRVTDSAILLDTSGRYQTEGGERDEWAALFETIKQYRKARPLDGVLLAVSASAVLRMNDTEIEQQAKILRARLDEAMQRTQTRFPVYLVFTHMDELEGFAEFFSTFSPEERAQVWGSTIPLAQSQNAHALFDAEFDHLYGRLLRRRMVQLGAPATSDQQLRIFKFPGRFRRARSRLGLFASSLFRPNPFSESPLLRGFYFTSSRGVGPVNARQLNGAEFFTRDFFKDVLLRDKDIVAATQASKQRPHLRRNILLGVAAMLVLTFFVGMIVSFFNNKALIAEADARGRKLTEIRKVTSKDQKNLIYAGEELEAVEGVRQLLSDLDYNQHNSPPLSLRFGLYSGNRLNSSDSSNPSILRHLYFEAVGERFLKPTVAKMEEDLRVFVSGAKSGPSVGTATSTTTTEEDYLGRHYDLLKVYLMLVKPDKVEPTFLANELRDYWKLSSPPGKEEDALKQLDFFASQADHEDAPHPEVDNALVSQAQNKLIAYPVVNRVYKRITAEVDSAVKYPVNLTTIPGAREGNIMVSSYSVPGSFTLDGYRAMREKLESSAADEFRKDDWVMKGSEATPQALDVKKDELANMYYRDYVAQWQRFLQEVKVRDFKSKEEAVKVLRVLSESNSPLESVLREVARQTNLSASASSGFFGWIKSLFSRQASGSSGSTQVEKEFRPLIQFMSGKEDASPVAQYRTKLKNVQDQLNNNAKPLSEISKVLQSGNDTLGLRAARQSIADLLESKGFGASPASDAAGRLLKQPLDTLNSLLVGTDYEQIEKVWQQLYAKAQGFESGFPFTDGSSDTSIASLAQFLNPQDGELTKFFNERLKPYFEDDWTIKREASDKFSPNFVNYLKNARRLRDALFPDGGKQPRVEYQIGVAPIKDASIKVEIDGNVISAPEKTSANFTWPGDKSGVKISVTPTSGGDENKPFAGEWGLLHMFRDGGGGDGKGAQFDLQFQVGTSAVRMTIQPKSGNVFQRELFAALKAPKSSQQGQ